MKQKQDFPSILEKNLDDSLKWDVHDIENKKEAFLFCKHFESYLPVYSSYLEKIYGKYDLIYNGEEEMITVIPNLEGLLHIFDHIDPISIEETPYSVMPGEVMNKKGIILFDKVTRETYPLGQGLAHMKDKTREEKNEVFSPLLKRDSLHYFAEGDSFILDIFRINYRELEKSSLLSAFEISGIQNYFHRKFIDFYYHGEKYD